MRSLSGSVRGRPRPRLWRIGTTGRNPHGQGSPRVNTPPATQAAAADPFAMRRTVMRFAPRGKRARECVDRDFCDTRDPP